MVNEPSVFELLRFDRRKKACLYIKQVYSRYAYIAFRENSHVSMEAQLILNNFLVYKSWGIQVKSYTKKNKCSKQKAECLFSHVIMQT